METEESHIYPIGRMNIPLVFERSELDRALDQMQVLPRILEHCIENLDEAQLATPYREGGWTPAQVTHHVADSHMNGFVRTKLALTEQKPTIAPYRQDDWVLSADVAKVPVNYSITLLHALHHRWVALFRSLSDDEWMRTYYHPEYDTTTALWQQAHNYAWHGRHHAEQIRHLRTRKGWT